MIADDPVEAKRSFIWDWITGEVQWQWFEFYGPECSVAVPAFTPEFLQDCLNNEFSYRVEKGVHIWEWYCCTGIHADNVAVFRFGKERNFLGFASAGTGREQDHLAIVDGKADRALMVEYAKLLGGQGLTQREISGQLGISVGAVNKYLRE